MLYRHGRMQKESSGPGVSFRRIAVRWTERYDTNSFGEPFRPPRGVRLDMRK